MDINDQLRRIVQKTDALLEEIRDIKKSGDALSEEQWKRLALLKAELNELSPADRFLWIEATPIADILKILSQEEVLE